MAILTKEKLATYGIELLVVVFGILIAFQVEEWREDRQRSRDLDAALIRLAEETAANIQNCEKVIPVLADHAQSVLAVVRVLPDGHLDMWRNHRHVCQKFEEIQSSLTKMNRH